MKKLLVLLLALVMVLALPACGGNGGDAPAADAPAEDTPASEAAPEEVPEEDDGQTTVAVGSGDTVITVMDGNASAVEECDAVIERFCNDNGIAAEIVHKPLNYDELIAAQINSNTIADVWAAQIGPQLTSYAEYAYDWTGDPILEKFRPEAIDAVTVDGRVIALPWTAETYALIYNKKLFAEAGITELPQSITELEEVCKKLESKGITAFANGNATPFTLGHLSTSFVAAENPDPQDTVDQINAGELSFATMKYFKNLFPVLDLMIEYGPEKPMEVDWERSEQMLASGEAAMIHMGNWCEALLMEFNPDVDVAFLPVPVDYEGTVVTKMNTDFAWGYVVHKDSPNLEQAKKLVEYYLTSDDGVSCMAEILAAIPPNKEYPTINGMLAQDAGNYISEGRSLPWAFQRYPAGMHVQIGQHLQSYMAGDVDAETCMENIQADWDLSL